MQQSSDIAYYLDVMKRRKLQFILPGAIVFLIIVAVAFLLPPVYKSSATILIEDQEIPQELVQTTVTGFVEERLQSITQVVLSHGNLLNIIKEFDLYPDLVGKYTTEEIISNMRDDILMEPITADVTNQYSGRPGSATIAFVLSYEGRTPQKVAQVANVLTSLYLKENLKEREEKAKSTFNFLELQLSELRSEVLELEEKIAHFKKEHVNELPELLVHNMNTMERLQHEMDNSKEQLATLRNRKVYLEGQLASLNPHLRVISNEGKRFVTSKEELEKLRREYLTLSSKYSDKHPEVMALKRQIKALGAEVEGTTSFKNLKREIELKEQRLTALKEKYSDKHPDVIEMRKEIDALNNQLEDASLQDPYLNDSETAPDNPGYIQIETQIASTELEIGESKRVYAEIQAQYDKYRKRVVNTPQVEQQYKILLRDYDNAQAKYQETNTRLLSAREAKGLEQSQLAERFTLVDPPIVPEKPVRPNRLALVLVGFVLSSGLGIGVGTFLEFMDRSVRRADDLSVIVGLPVLATVPYWVTQDELKHQIRRKRAIFMAGVVGIVALLAATHFFYMPLDVIAVKILRKVSFKF